jgi:cytochrome c553
MKHRSVVVLAAMAGSLAGEAARAQDADGKLVRYGEHLSRECTACHRRDGVDNGIPSILGMKAGEFTELMQFYQTGARENPAMVSVAQSLDEDQIKALAAFFATLPPPPKRSPAPPAATTAKQ